MDINYPSFKYFIPFGCMCSLAIFLREKGFRSCSSFFDWLDSSLEGNITIVEENFNDVLKKDFLSQQFPLQPWIVSNKKYGFSYVHLFNDKVSFSNQIKKNTLKVTKQINHFKEMLAENSCLIYYVRKKEDKKFIESNCALISNFLMKYKTNIVFITNMQLKTPFKSFFIKINNIHKPFGGGVSFPFEGTDELEKWLDAHYINDRTRNISFNNKRKNCFLVLTTKIQHKFFKKTRLKL